MIVAELTAKNIRTLADWCRDELAHAEVLLIAGAIDEQEYHAQRGQIRRVIGVFKGRDHV